MIRRLTGLTRLRHTYDNPIDQQRAQLLANIMLVALAGSVLIGVYILFLTLSGAAEVNAGTISAFTGPFIALGIYSLVQFGRLNIAVYTLVTLSAISGIASLSTGIDTVNAVTLLIPIVVAGVLLSWRGTVLTFIGIEFVLIGTIVSNAPTVDAIPVGDLLLFSVIHFIIMVTLIAFATNLRSSATDFVEQVDELFEIAQLGLQATESISETELSHATINTVRDSLGYTFAQIFMVNDDQEVNRRIATALNTTEMNIYTEVDLSPRSGIYDAVRSQEPVIITREMNELRRDHLLPGVIAGAAVPIIGGGQILGVLDVQREQEDSFTPTEINTLFTLAQRLGQLLRQRRRTEALENGLQNQSDIINRLRTKLQDYERSEEERTTGAWETYLQQRGVDMIGYDLNWRGGDHELTRADDLPDDIHTALDEGDIVVRDDGDMQRIHVPITLRGQMLGAMSFRVPPGRQSIGPRQKELIRSVIQRLGLALENKRLFEQSQSQAQRERTANEVGARLLSTTDVQAVMQLAASNFNEALGAVQTRIYLQPDANEPTEDASS